MKKKLHGKTVIVTRAVEQADELIKALREQGAEVIHIPTIQFVEPDSWTECDSAMQQLDTYRWLIFTSSSGVEWFLRRLHKRRLQIARFNTLRTAAVGEGTEAVLKAKGVPVALVPENYSAVGLLESFKRLDLQAENVLIAQAQQARATLKEGLMEQGANVTAVAVYKTVPVELLGPQNQLNGRPIDVLTFTSPSTVKSFVSMFGKEKIQSWRRQGCTIAAIGGVTARAIANLDFQVDILPSKSTVAKLVVAITEYYN